MIAEKIFPRPDESLLSLSCSQEILQDSKGLVLKKNTRNYKDGDFQTDDILASNKGRWTIKEKMIFLEALKNYGNDWEAIRQIIPTRSGPQIRSHAQKYYDQIKRHEIKKLRDTNKLGKKLFIVTRFHRNWKAIKHGSPYELEFDSFLRKKARIEVTDTKKITTSEFSVDYSIKLNQTCEQYPLFGNEIEDPAVEKNLKLDFGLNFLNDREDDKIAEPVCEEQHLPRGQFSHMFDI
jgi:SHAQKYF class myb-like DNA-binding protein